MRRLKELSLRQPMKAMSEKGFLVLFYKCIEGVTLRRETLKTILLTPP